MAKTPKRPARDIALLHGPTEDGKGARVLRFRDGTVSAGEVRPAREGQPLGSGELVRLRPLHEQLPMCEVEVLHGPEQAEAKPRAADAGRATRGAEGAEADGEGMRSGKGPARVSSRRYRRNWGLVFGDGRRRDADADAGASAEPDYSIN